MKPDEFQPLEAETPPSSWRDALSDKPASPEESRSLVSASHPTQTVPRMQGCTGCGHLVDVAGVEPLTPWSCPACGAANTAEGRLGNYALAAIAGRGGMGTVYRAWDESLGRWVAIKVLRKDQTNDPLTIKRLEAEAGLTATINHPNVVRVFSTGRDADRFYIVMELVDQGSLEELIRGHGKVAEWDVLNVGIQAARGLQAAQMAGLIHRDVKPGNILFGEDRAAKIVDFGLAIFQEEEEASRGEIWGTPYYVAPEKLDSLPEDFRSDMYSLGGTLFHALAGRPPFEAEDASHVALKHLKSQPVSIQTFAPWVSNATAFIINRTLSKDPDARFQSYDELIENLEYARDALMAEAGVPPTKARVVLEDEKEQRAWGWVTLAALGVAVIGVILAAVFWKQIFSGKRNANETANDAPKMQESPWPVAAIQAWSTGEYKSAGAIFQSEAEKSKQDPMKADWLRMGHILSMKLQGDQNASGEAIHSLLADIPGVGVDEMTTFIKDVATRLGRNTVIDPAELSSVDRTSYKAFAWFAYGVQNIALGKNSEGMAMLREFRSITPAREGAWIGDLKSTASNLMDATVQFDMQTANLNAETNSLRRAKLAFEMDRNMPIFASRIAAVLKPYEIEMKAYARKVAAPPVEGAYRIINRATGLHLDAHSGENKNGGRILGVEPHGGVQQKWDFVPQPNGLWKLVNRHNKRALGVRKGSENGQMLEQADVAAVEEQMWRIENIEREWFKLVSVATEQVLSNRKFSYSGSEPREVGMEKVANPTEFVQWRFAVVEEIVSPWRLSEVGYLPEMVRLEVPNPRIFEFSALGGEMWGRNDGFRYLRQRLTGDFSISAKVESFSNTGEWGKVGLMVRCGLRDYEEYVGAILTKERGLDLQYRLTPGGETAIDKTNEKTLPIWIRLERVGKQIKMSHSLDGTKWTSDGSRVIERLSEAVFAGLVVSAREPQHVVNAVFSDVQISLPDGKKGRTELPVTPRSSAEMDSASPGNLLSEGGFEDLPDGPYQGPWQGDKRCEILVETAQQHSGKKSLWMSVPKGEGWVFFHRNVPVEPQKTYVVSAWLRRSESLEGCEAAVGGRDVGSDGRKAEHKSKPTMEWTKLEKRFASEGRTSINVFFTVLGTKDATGWIRLDDFELKQE